MKNHSRKASTPLANCSVSIINPPPLEQLYSIHSRAKDGLVVPQPSRSKMQSKPLLYASLNVPETH
jgi:hypothetical protein